MLSAREAFRQGEPSGGRRNAVDIPRARKGRLRNRPSFDTLFTPDGGAAGIAAATRQTPQPTRQPYTRAAERRATPPPGRRERIRPPTQTGRPSRDAPGRQQGVASLPANAARSTFAPQTSTPTRSFLSGR